MRLLGIGRAPRFSPHSTARDAAILGAVAGVLRQQGHTVTLCNEDDLGTTAAPLADGADRVFSMARDTAVLHRLAALAAGGLPVVNAPGALLEGSRRRLTQRFVAASLPVAPVTDLSTLLPTAATAPLDALMADGRRYWLKRGEACAQSAGDVTLVTDTATLRAALVDFGRRGVTEALLSPHIEGDLVKFYGVEGTDFFDVYYPTGDGDAFSKFGLERHNGRPQGFALDRRRLKADADAAARCSGFTVYGGDAVVTATGQHVLIDFNDWPSFARCRDAAAVAIARRLLLPS